MGRKERREKEKKIRIKQIENAAKKVFFEKGYKNTRIEEIAKIAELSKGTIYLYFRNKEDLYIALMRPVLEQINKRLKNLEICITNNQKKYATSREIITDLFEVFYDVYKCDTDGLKIIRAFQQGEYFLAMSEEKLAQINEVAKSNNIVARGIISKAMKLSSRNTSELDVIKLNDLIWALFIGIIQLEESKLRATKKDHILCTLKFAFSLICDAICSD